MILAGEIHSVNLTLEELQRQLGLRKRQEDAELLEIRVRMGEGASLLVKSHRECVFRLDGRDEPLSADEFFDWYFEQGLDARCRIETEVDDNFITRQIRIF